MKQNPFRWHVIGYYRFPVIAKMMITNRIDGMMEIVQEFAEWNDRKITSIRVFRDDKVLFTLRRTKDKWVEETENTKLTHI